MTCVSHSDLLWNATCLLAEQRLSTWQSLLAGSGLRPMTLLLELFAFLSPLFHLVQSVSHGSWAAAFTGGLVPLVQLGWKWGNQRSVEIRCERLRQKVTSLHEFQNVLKDDTGNPTAAKLFHNAQREREEALLALSNLATQREQRKSVEPGPVRHWFLLYAPTGIASLTLHVLFYACLSATVILLSVLVLVGLRDRSALAGFEIGIGVWLMLVLIVRTVAAAVDRVGAPSRLEHWVLLYKPERPAGWILRGLFYITLTFTLLIAPVLVSMVRVDGDSAEVLLGFGAFATIPLFLRYLVFLLERKREPNRFEKWLLLYRPTGIGGWVLRILFYVSLTFSISVLAAVLITAKEPDDDVQGTLGGLALFVVLTFLSQGLTAALEQNRQPNRFQRWFLLYRPARRAGWIAHGLFYLCVVVCVVFMAFMVIGAPEEPDPSERHLLLAMFASNAVMTIVFRGLAIDYDPNAPSTPEPGAFRSALLLHSPTRQVLWIPQILFYVLLFGLLTDIMLSIDEPDEVIVPAYLALLALAFRQFVASYDRTTNPAWVKWLMLAHPSSPIAWIPRTMFYAAMLSLPAVLVRLVRAANGQMSIHAMGENTNFLVWVVIPTVLIVLASQGWAESYELPPNSLLPSTANRMLAIRNALLLYVPIRLAAWLPVMVFYLVGVTLILTVANFPAVRIPERFDKTVVEVMLLCLLVSASGWARRYRLAGPAQVLSRLDPPD